MKKFIKENWFKIMIIIILLLSIYDYHNLKYTELHYETNLKIEKMSQESVANYRKAMSLNTCLNTAKNECSLIWNNMCSNGLGNWVNICQGEQGKDCIECVLSEKQSIKLDKLLKNRKLDCFKQYK